MRLLFNQNLWIILLTATLFGCSGDDDGDGGGRTTDPIIGTWRASFVDEGDDAVDVLTFNASGSWSIETTLNGDDMTTDTVRGTWRNTGNDFNETRQTIILSFDPIVDDGETIQLDDETFVWIFSSNFNTMRVEGDDYNRTYTRQ